MNQGHTWQWKAHPLEFIESATPFTIHTSRVILLAFQEPTRNELESLVSQSILKSLDDEPLDWYHPIVVPMSNGGVCITIDLPKFNGQVSCPTPRHYLQLSKISALSNGSSQQLMLSVVIGRYPCMRTVNTWPFQVVSYHSVDWCLQTLRPRFHVIAGHGTRGCKIVQCDSRLLTDAEKRYVTIEQEIPPWT